MTSEPIDTKKILLVEDNLLNCEVAADMLESFGVEVDVANNGLQALELYQQHEYALIFMDCEMPVMDGFAAAAGIRSIQEKSQRVPSTAALTPIIALTAHATSSIKEQCLSCGMDDFLSKPFNLSDLNSVLVKWQVLDKTDCSVTQTAEADERIHSADIDNIDSDWAILDYETFRKYYLKQKKDGSNFVNNIVSIYLAQSSGLLDDLTVAVKGHDVETIRVIAHTLKSSSQNVGASYLSASCRAVELACMDGNIEDELVARIYPDYTAAEKALNQILDNVSN